MNSSMSIFLNDIKKYSNSDHSIIKRLKKSPKEVFEEFSKIKLPDTFKVEIYTISEPKEIVISLPPSPEMLKQIGQSNKDLQDFYMSMFFFAENDKDGREKIKNINLQQLIASKAWKDESFMKLLNEDPHKAIQSILSKKLDENLKITVLKNTLTTLYLPLEQEQSDIITDSELQSMAGGVSFMGPANIFLDVVENVNSFIVESASEIINTAVNISGRFK